MVATIKIASKTGDPVIDVALDTITKEKQALVFVNTKKSAEKEAEEISKKTTLTSETLTELAEKVRTILPRPTAQCERLARCVKKGTAFHHAGLHSKQKELVEEHFKQGNIRIISATPTLAAGINLPAFRAVIRDLKRFSNRGMVWIPVLEFLQMAGRCGRPGYDEWGEAIVITKTETEKDHAMETYLQGEPEPIYSKLAVEPVLRTYVLSLIASKIIGSEKSIIDFFSKTFWAHQFGDLTKLENTINKVLDLLIEWKFITQTVGGYKATPIGERVAQLYLDPLTASQFVTAVDRAAERKPSVFAWLHVISNTLEMQPLLRVRTKEFEVIEDKLVEYNGMLLQREPTEFEPEYDDWLNATKTAMMFEDWINEKDDEYLLESYNVRPGESRAKLRICEWLMYALTEMAKLNEQFDVVKDIQRAKLRLKYGVRDELIPLVKIPNIGRARARKLFRNNIKDLADLKKTNLETLSQLLGQRVANRIKKELGEKVPDIVSPKKRKGQMGLSKFEN